MLKAEVYRYPLKRCDDAMCKSDGSIILFEDLEGVSLVSTCT